MIEIILIGPALNLLSAVGRRKLNCGFTRFLSLCCAQTGDCRSERLVVEAECIETTASGYTIHLTLPGEL